MMEVGGNVIAESEDTSNDMGSWKSCDEYDIPFEEKQYDKSERRRED